MCSGMPCQGPTSCAELVINLRIPLAQANYFCKRITWKPREKKNALQNKVNSAGVLFLVCQIRTSLKFTQLHFNALTSKIYLHYIYWVGRDSSVRLATRYGLEGPGIESRWRRDFPQPSRPPWGPLSLLYNGYRVSLPGVKRPGRCVDHPPPPSAEVKEKVQLYLYSTSRPSWPVLG